MYKSNKFVMICTIISMVSFRAVAGVKHPTDPPKEIKISGNKVCQGDLVKIEAKNMESSFYWSLSCTGNDTLSVSDSLVVSLAKTTTFYLFEPGTGFIDSAAVEVFNPVSNVLPSDTSFCEENYITLTPLIKADRYEWSTGDTTESLRIFVRGSYQITLYNGGCVIKDQITVNICPADVYVPSGFTPNGDGMNDVFIVSAEQLHSFNLEVYDRWGKPVFATKDPSIGWDGTYGELLPSGVYVYTLSYTEDQASALVTKTGTVTLMR